MLLLPSSPCVHIFLSKPWQHRIQPAHETELQCVTHRYYDTNKAHQIHSSVTFVLFFPTTNFARRCILAWFFITAFLSASR